MNETLSESLVEKKDKNQVSDTQVWVRGRRQT